MLCGSRPLGGFLAAIVVAGGASTAGCGSADLHESDLETGRVTLPLRTEVDGAEYRLRNGVFTVDGPTAGTLHTEDDPDASSMEAVLTVGTYVVTLEDGWRLEREFGVGFETVAASLESTNPRSFEILPEAVTPIAFVFSTDGRAIREDVLGFEDPSLWSSDTAQLAGSATRIQGERSLAIQGSAFNTVSSVPLSFLELSDNQVTVAVQLPAQQPNPYWFGNIQLLLDASSAGIHDELIGIVALTGLPTRQFVDVSFELPAEVMDRLSVGFDDLVIRLALNLPSDAQGTYYLDNLRLGGVTACDLSCEDGTCVDGVCQIDCPSGFGDCDGSAANGCEAPLSEDSRNCGACGHQCEPGTMCQEGSCEDTAQCASTEADCDGDNGNLCETDVSADPDNCGGCGIECGTGEACMEGSCLSGELAATLVITTDWGSGYCALLNLTNEGTETTNSWQVTLDLKGTTVTGSWNGNFSGPSGTVTIDPLTWNARIPPGTTNTSVGFCAARSPGTSNLPEMLGALP